MLKIHLKLTRNFKNVSKEFFSFLTFLDSLFNECGIDTSTSVYKEQHYPLIVK